MQVDAVMKAASARCVRQPVFCRMGTTAAGFDGLLLYLAQSVMSRARFSNRSPRR